MTLPRRALPQPAPGYAARVSAFDDLAAIGPLPIWDGLVARAVQGERITLAVVEVEPDAALPEHSHYNEQLGVVISGTLTLRVGDEERVLSAGERGGSGRTPPIRGRPAPRERSSWTPSRHPGTIGARSALWRQSRRAGPERPPAHAAES